jgi:hypothetical protein
VCFPKTFEKVRHVLVCDEPILCSGKAVKRGHRRGRRVEDPARGRAADQRAAQGQDHQGLHRPQRRQRHPEQIGELRTILLGAPRGACQAIVRLAIPQRSQSIIPLGDRWMVSPSDDLLGRLERVFGERIATLA